MGTKQDNNIQRWEMEARLHHVDRQFFLVSSLICDAERTYNQDWADRVNEMVGHLTQDLGEYMEENPIDLVALHTENGALR